MKMNMTDRYLHVIVLVTISTCVLQVLGVLVLDKHVSGEVKETERSKKIVCFSCRENDTSVPQNNIFINKVSVYPNSYCRNCFDVNKNPDADNFCVFFQGILNYTLEQEYVITVLCTNGVTRDTIRSSGDSNIVIKVIPNEPPSLVSNPNPCQDIDVERTSATNDVYSSLLLSMRDPEGDHLYCSMTTLPPSENFEIDEATCVIRAKTDLTVECSPSISFQVMVTDRHNAPVGPITISCSMTNFAQPPKIPNLNLTTFMREDIVVGQAAYTFDRIEGPRVSYRLHDVRPPQARGLFTIEDRQLILQEKLDYENVLFQEPIYIELFANNRLCDPVYHYLNVRLLDVNEPPVLNRETYYEEVGEEQIYVNPQFNCQDEEDGNSCTYAIIEGNEDGKFQINEKTGEITAKTFNIDDINHLEFVDRQLKIIAYDSQGLNDTAIVNLRIEDINDNRPKFEDGESSIAYTVTECDEPATLPRGLRAVDFDSNRNKNNEVQFLNVKSDCLEIHTDGSVQLLRSMKKPESCSLQTRAVDQGEPQLTSTTVATVTVGVTDCVASPAPVAPAPAPAPAPAATAAAPSTDTGGANSVSTVVNATLGSNIAGADFGLIFGILGGILGALLLASLLAYCCRRFCIKKKTAPFSSDKTVTKKAKKFDNIKKNKQAKAAAAAGPAVGAAAVAPNLVQRFVRVRRRIPFLHFRRRVPVQTVRRVVPLGSVPPLKTTMPVRSAPGSVRTVLPAPPPYRMSGTAPIQYRSY